MVRRGPKGTVSNHGPVGDLLPHPSRQRGHQDGPVPQDEDALFFTYRPARISQERFVTCFCKRAMVSSEGAVISTVLMRDFEPDFRETPDFAICSHFATSLTNAVLAFPFSALARVRALKCRPVAPCSMPNISSLSREQWAGWRSAAPSFETTGPSRWPRPSG